MPVRIRVNTVHSGEPLSALIAKLEYPVPLLEELGHDLAEILRANVAPHVASGTLLEGIDDVVLYKKRGTQGDIWAVGIGNPNILTDWNQKAPPGTIAAFLRWVFSENERLRGKHAGKRRRAEVKKQQALQEKRAARAAKHSAVLGRRNARRAQKADLSKQYFEALGKVARNPRPSGAEIGKLEHLRDLFTARGVSFERLGRISSYFVRRQYRGAKTAPDVIREFSQTIAYLFTRSRHQGRLRYDFEQHAKAFEKYFTGRSTFPGFRFEKPKPPKLVKIKAVKVPKAAKPVKAKTLAAPKPVRTLKEMRKSAKVLGIKVLKTKIAAKFTKVRLAKAKSANLYSPFLRLTALIAWWKYRTGGRYRGR